MSLAKSTPYLIYLVFIATLGPLQFGYHLAELNAPQAVITCEEGIIHPSAAANVHALPQCIPMAPSQFGLVSSIYTLGGFIGALLAGPVATRYGRLFVMRLTTVFFMLGPVAGALAPTISVMSAGRLLSGVSAGAAIVVCPIYISEISPPDSKGFFGAFTQVMTNVGILLSQALGYFLSVGSMWRIILAAPAIIGGLELFGLLFVPESPIWLSEHQMGTQARDVIQRIRGKGTDIEGEVRKWPISAGFISGSEEEESLLPPSLGGAPSRKAPVTISQAVLNPYYRPAIIAVIAVMVAQQFTGINSIIMYSVSLLQTILPATAALVTVIVSALNLIMTLACSPLPDRIGRKTCLLLSIAGMGSSSVLLALGIYYGQEALSTISVLLFVASFAVGLGPVPFILASELVGPEAVGAAQSWALAANWLSTFIVAQFFPIVNNALGGRGRVYWLFSSMAVLLGGFIYRYVPETKGKSNADDVWSRGTRRTD